MKTELLVLGLFALQAVSGVVISNATCESFATGSIATGSHSVNATLFWQHDCGNQSTTFTLVGEAPGNGTGNWGWLGVGFIEASKLNPDYYMTNADLYLFASHDDVFMNGIAHNNTRPQPQNVSDVIGTPTFNISGDLFTVSFSRPWAPLDAAHADLTAGPLRVLAARGLFSNGTFGFHHDNALLVYDPLYLFQTPPTPAPTQMDAANPCLTQNEFSNHFQLMLGSMPVDVNYTIDCVNATASFTVSTETTGWFALGFNTESSMNGVNAFQCTVTDNGTADVREAFADNHHVSAVQTPNSLLTGAPPTGTLVNGLMTVTFTRHLAAPNGTASDGNARYALSASSPLYILAARRVNDSDMSRPHMNRTPLGRASSAVPVQLFTLGTVIVGGDGDDYFSNSHLLITAHGLAMVLAWAVLGNVGAFVSRNLKALGHRWYLLHRHIMLGLAFLCALGFALGFAHVQVEGGRHFVTLIQQGDLRVNPHSVLGLAICVAMVVQIALGFIANRLFDKLRRATPWWPDRIHAWFGRLLLLASFVNIYLGLWLMNEHIFSASVVAFVIFKIITGVMHVWGGCSIKKIESYDFSETVNGGGLPDESDHRFDSDLRPLLGGVATVSQKQAEVWLVRLRIFAFVLTVLAFVITVLAWHQYGGNLMGTPY